MKSKRIFIFVTVLILATSLVACSKSIKPVDMTKLPEKSRGQIYLYGETHGIEKIMEKELELWGQYYDEEDMRHLFVELPYYTAEFLNLWMKSDNNDTLDELYNDWEGTAGHTPYTKEFYKEIKSQWPETIFHGTDVGHQYHTTGQSFLEYLEEKDLENTETYLLTSEAIEQGKNYYDKKDNAYRENKMTENFVREFDKLKDENIMGIYGGAHTDINAMEYMTKSVPSMANQLKGRYGDALYTEDLSWLAKEIEALRVDVFTINEKEYKASYFGKEDLTGFKNFSYREFWRLEDAYEDFKDHKKTGDVLPYNNYPMLIEEGQVFVMDLGKIDGSLERIYYRSDGMIWQGQPSTEEFTVE